MHHIFYILNMVFFRIHSFTICTRYNLFVHRKKNYQLLICRVAKNLPVLELLNHFIKSSTIACKRVAYKKNLVYVVWHIKSVFPKLSLLLRVWQRHFFTELERRVKQRNSPFKNNFYHFKLKLYTSVLNLKHTTESGGVSMMLNLVFMYLKENS